MGTIIRLELSGAGQSTQLNEKSIDLIIVQEKLSTLTYRPINILSKAVY